MVGINEGILNNIIDILIEGKIINLQKAREDCTEMEKELISVSKKILEKLGSEKSLFMRYEELSTIDENNTLRDAYKQGFNNGISLLRECLKL